MNPFSTKVLAPRQPPGNITKSLTPKAADFEPSIEEQKAPTAPPIRKLKPPRSAPMFKTALDSLGDGDDGLSQEIGDFSTQEVAAPQAPSQNIEEDKGKAMGTFKTWSSANRI